MHRDLLLVGDIGGTNTRLRALTPDSRIIAEKTYSDRLPVAEALKTFVAEHNLGGRLSSAAFGAAGRVERGVVRMTNRPGEVVSEAEEARVLGLPADRVRIVNDMVAHVAGVAASDSACVRQGEPYGLVEGIVMPGTGLGVGYAVTIQGRRHPMPSEGGHLDFGVPSRQIESLRPALSRMTGGRLTWEHVLSGPGLARLYAALADVPTLPRPEHVTQAAGGEGVEGVDPDPAAAAVRLLLELTGVRAGNLCLGVLSTAGVWLGGSILVGLYRRDPQAFTSAVVEAFDGCGPDAVRDTLRRTPIRLLTSPDSGLLGAAALARELARADT